MMSFFGPNAEIGVAFSKVGDLKKRGTDAEVGQPGRLAARGGASGAGRVYRGADAVPRGIFPAKLPSDRHGG